MNSMTELERNFLAENERLKALLREAAQEIKEHGGYCSRFTLLDRIEKALNK